jgi:heptose I phosphotransferase
MNVFLNQQWESIWRGKDPFAEACALEGTVYRSKEGRRTLRFEHEGKGYFLKLHEGIGWREIFKNLFQLRLPVLGATNEYRACVRLQQLGVDTMTPVAYGVRGSNPASQLSFLVTEALENTVSLEDYCKAWQTDKPSVREKRAIIRKLADISKTLHDNGINHRDYYLCHFLRSNNGMPYQYGDSLFLIDLHRVQIRPAVPERWLVKDLAGLLYSALDLPVTRNDVLYFLAHYRRDWMRNGKDEKMKIARRAFSLYQKDFGRNPPDATLPLLSMEQQP